MKIYPTREEAIKAAVEQYGQLALDTQTVNVVKIGPMIAKHLRCDAGFAIETIEKD